MVMLLLKRLLAAVFLVSFLSGAIAEAMPAAMDGTRPCDMTMMAGFDGSAGMPCQQDKAAVPCVPLIGCAAVAAALPAPVNAPYAAAFAWALAWFPNPPGAIAGRSVQPAVFPPIKLA